LEDVTADKEIHYQHPFPNKARIRTVGGITKKGRGHSWQMYALKTQKGEGGFIHLYRQKNPSGKKRGRHHGRNKKLEGVGKGVGKYRGARHPHLQKRIAKTKKMENLNPEGKKAHI